MVVVCAELLGYLLNLLGPRVRSWVAWSLAFLAFDVFRMRRKLVLKNIARMYGSKSSEQQCSRVARASLANFILTTLEFFAARHIFPKQQIDYRNPEIIRQALARGKGVFLIGIHMGNFELLGTIVGRNFARMNAPTKLIGRGQLAQWVRARREKNGIVEVVNEKGQASSRTSRILEALGRNEAIGFMVDQRRVKGVLLPFFGEPAWTNVGLFTLWKLHEAPIVPISIHRKGNNRSEIIFYNEFIVSHDPTWTKEQFLAENGARMNAVVEEMISENPEEYFWMHDRWKNNKSSSQ